MRCEDIESKCLTDITTTFLVEKKHEEYIFLDKEYSYNE